MIDIIQNNQFPMTQSPTKSLKFLNWIWGFIFFISSIQTFAQQKPQPGPYFKPVNNDSIYNLNEAPAYEPFAVPRPAHSPYPQG